MRGYLLARLEPRSANFAVIIYKKNARVQIGEAGAWQGKIMSDLKRFGNVLQKRFTAL